MYSIHGKDWYVLYEYNDFLERLWFRYKDQRDLLLRSLFLEEIDPRFFLSYSICGLCSSEAKRFERGFEPLRDIFIAQGLDFYSPFYKEKDWKQNQMDKVQRSGIVSVLKKKRFFPSIEKPIVLVDDVCTTGASLEAALSLVDCAIIFVVSAHPKWIEEHKKDIVERKRVPWKSSAKQVERRWTGFLKKRLYSEDGGKL